MLRKIHVSEYIKLRERFISGNISTKEKDSGVSICHII